MFIVQEIGSIVPSAAPSKECEEEKNAKERGTRPTFETGVITSVVTMEMGILDT